MSGSHQHNFLCGLLVPIQQGAVWLTLTPACLASLGPTASTMTLNSGCKRDINTKVHKRSINLPALCQPNLFTAIQQPHELAICMLTDSMAIPLCRLPNISSLTGMVPW